MVHLDLPDPKVPPVPMELPVPTVNLVPLVLPAQLEELEKKVSAPNIVLWMVESSSKMEPDDKRHTAVDAVSIFSIVYSLFIFCPLFSQISSNHILYHAAQNFVKFKMPYFSSPFFP